MIFIAVIIVSAVCGFTMSIIRAGVTYILIALSLVLGRSNTPANTLGAAVSLVLLNNPYAIFNVAFQLSVLSTFGILVVAVPCIDFIKENEYVKNKVLFYLISSSLISIPSPGLSGMVMYPSLYSILSFVTSLRHSTSEYIISSIQKLGLFAAS